MDVPDATAPFVGAVPVSNRALKELTAALVVFCDDAMISTSILPL
jgi:hypothetical protein